MPTSVSELFKSAGLNLAGRVSWGQTIRDDQPGVYVLSLSLLPTDCETGCLKTAPIDSKTISTWISRVPKLSLDGLRPTPIAVIERLSTFWLPDETILYVGKAGTSVKRRVGQYYRTPLGDSKPHAGGHWIKTLSVLSKLSFFWALTNTPEQVEDDLLARFIQNVSDETKSTIHDPKLPIPFANLEFPKGNSKNHGFGGSVNRD